MNTGTGNVKAVVNQLTYPVEATTGTGDVEISSQQSINNINYQLQTGTGLIHILDQSMEHEAKGQMGTGKTTIQISTGTGDIVVRNSKPTGSQ